MRWMERHQIRPEAARRMKTIPLTRGLMAIVDDADYASLAAHKWYAKKKRATAQVFYASRKVNRRSVDMHRVILGLTDGALECHHLNGDGLDNRRENLQALTKAEHRHRHMLAIPRGARDMSGFPKQGCASRFI